MQLFLDQCRRTNKYLKMKLILHFYLIFSLIIVLARGQIQDAWVIRSPMNQNSNQDSGNQIQYLIEEENPILDSTELRSQTEDSKDVRSQIQDSKAIPDVISLARNYSIDYKNLNNNPLLKSVLKNTIQYFLVTNMFNVMPISTILDNAQILFFTNLEMETKNALKANLKPNISLECLNSMREFGKGLKEMRIWAIEMVDSFGKLPNGILEGTVNTLGDYDQCINTNVPDKFQGRYCRLAIKTPNKYAGTKEFNFKPIDISPAFNRNSSKTLSEMSAAGGMSGLDYVPLTTSICVPSTCSAEEVGYLLATVNKPNQDSFSITVHHCRVKNDLKWTSTQKIILTAMIILILFELFATMIDYRISLLHPDEEYRSTLKLRTKCLLSFSYRSNAIRLFKRDDNPDSIKIFHGMRSITMIWIILGHTILYNTQILSRVLDALRMARSFSFQIAVNPFSGPDTFFFMSGFLVVYSYMKLNLPKISFIHYVLYRYIRLVPPLMFMMGILILSVSIGQGPMFKEYLLEEFTGHCGNSWWKNVLCINNYYEIDEQCMLWTWFIAVDFQLYVVCYFLLGLFKRNPRRVLFILKATIVANAFYLMAFYVYYDLPPIPFLTYNTPRAAMYYVKMAHYRPEPHVGSYCFGILMGYYIATQKKIKLTRSLKIIGWSTSTIFGGIVVFTTYVWNSGHVATALESALYGGFHRILWCLMLSWITYMCTTEKGGVVKSILSWHGFVPLGRLTYMAFLLHPIIIIVCSGRTRHLFTPDYVLVCYSLISYTFLTYFLSFIFCMICEAPFTGLLSVLISSKVRKNDRSGVRKSKGSFAV